MSHDCCGDSRVAGDSLTSALRSALHLLHDSLSDFLLVSSDYRSWTLHLAVVSMLLLLLALAGLFVIKRTVGDLLAWMRYTDTRYGDSETLN
ncbi:hypothetical protein X777_06160 [Ooceraea biroi]|uniref:Uncharacterized protein n=1 Tax=Ooceraea biroi TaxID=2015173 RepID=A0A026WDV7_OOCBI|nr:hypothetical protein X777_06160 [Ooceraea biroi]